MRTGSHDIEFEKFHCDSWPRKLNGIMQLGIEWCGVTHEVLEFGCWRFETSVVQGKNKIDVPATQKSVLPSCLELLQLSKFNDVCSH